LHSHFPALLGTLAAGSSTCLAVFVIVLGALFGAPFADVRAKFAVLGCIFTVAGQRFGTEAADVQAFAAAVRAIIVTFLADHLLKAVFAVGEAFQTGVYAGLVVHVFL
jgi:hypothetical protein